MRAEKEVKQRALCLDLFPVIEINQGSTSTVARGYLDRIISIRSGLGGFCITYRSVIAS